MITLRGVIGADPEALARAGSWVRQPGGHSLDSSVANLSIVVDHSYRLIETPSGLLIHDGRIRGWSDDPLQWNGSFLAVAPQGQGLRFWTDRLGTIPLFCAAIPGGTVVSSRLADLLELRDFGPDPTGILQAVILNHPVGRRTILEGVSLAPPASAFDVTAAGLQERGRYWKPAIGSGERDRPRERIEQGMAVLEGASERALRDSAGPVAWPVTGGADSRCCLALNRSRLGRHDVLFHVTELGRHELPIARAVADELQRELQVFDPTDSIRRVTEADPRAESGELHAGQWFLQPSAQALAGRFHCIHVVDGYLLDSLLKPSKIQQGTTGQVRDRLLHRARYRLQQLGISTDDARARRMLETAAADFPADDAGMVASQRYTLENRSRRMIFGHVRLQGNHLAVRTPGLDSELIDFAMDLPWACRENGWLYRRIIHELDPALGRIPHDRTGLPLIADESVSTRRTVLSGFRYYLNRMLPGPNRFPGKESRFERLLRTDAGFRNSVYARIEESEWIAEAMGDGTITALERQRRSGRIISDCLGNMLQVALLERYAHANDGDRRGE